MSKKLNKKWKKIYLKLERDGLPLTYNKTNIIAIANAGLGNGVNVKQVEQLLESFGKLSGVFSLNNKSYAVACFQDIDVAVECFEAIQGHILVKPIEQTNSTLFVYFLASLPSNFVHPSDNSKDSTLSCHKLPCGLFKYDEFITTEEEEYLLSHIETDISLASTNHINETLKRRTVLHYGFQFCYGSNDVNCNSPLSADGLPKYAKAVLSKLMTLGHFISEPDQLTINRYEPGDGIPSHVDNPAAFEEPLATLSLGSSVVMEMKSQKNEKVSIFLKPRTLLVFTGESRYLWTHGIPAKKTDIVCDQNSSPCLLERKTRLSMTFRKVVYTSKLHYSLPNNGNDAVNFEKELVHNVYENIAQHFSCTREKPWPKVVEFLNGLKTGSLVLDVGCGSGRYLNVKPNINMIGCDYCTSLVSICSEKQSSVFICDCLNIPVKTNVFDASICIAVIHHFSTFERQLRAVKELIRVITSGGLCLIYVWAAEQKKDNINSSYLKTKNTQFNDNCDLAVEGAAMQQSSHPLVVHKNRTEFVQQDVLVPWKTKKNVTKAIEEKFGKKSCDATFYRFYHVFKKNELEKLCSHIPNCNVVSSYYDNGNWSVILKKL